MKTSFFWLFLGLCLSLLSCQEEEVYIPKKRIYPKVVYPERNYQALDTNFCAFHFDYPDYMEFVQDTTLGNRQALHPCWFDLNFKSLNGRLHFTYTDLSKGPIEEELYKMYSDAYRLAEEHTAKAASLDDYVINRPEDKVYGVLFNIEGHVASPFQLLLTDSSQHAVRASLYFNTRPEADSMAPVIDFVKTDVMGMVNSFKWGNSQ